MTAPAQQRLRDMMLVRRFEERCAELYGAGKIRGFLHLYIGEEAVAAGILPALGPADTVVATYREHGHALLRGVPARAVMAEMFGRVTGCSRGRGGSMHLFDAERRLYGGWAIVAGHLPVAVGLALADRTLGRPQVTACFFGDGAVAEGAFHEAMNLSALWQLPVLFVCENNLYAMGTALERYQAQPDLVLRARGYGVEAASVDGMDVEIVEAAAAEAVARVRAGKPFLLECRTYRFRAHSMFDAELYRNSDEVARWKQRDPIPLLAGRLRERGQLDDATLSVLQQDIAREVEDAVRFADDSALEPIEELGRHVMAEAAP